MTRGEAAKLVAVVVAACPTTGTRLDAGRIEAMIAAYAELLGDLPYENVNRAVRVLLELSPYMPAIADIRRKVIELDRGRARNGIEAWGDVLRAVSKFGARRTPLFEDPLVARCVDAMGWHHICASENAVADRARFAELYEHHVDRARELAQSPTLAAAEEARQLERGHEAKAIGSILRALTKGEP